jgi:hypothetical protein
MPGIAFAGNVSGYNKKRLNNLSCSAFSNLIECRETKNDLN